MIDKVGYTRPTTAAKGVKKAGQAGASGFANALSTAEGALGATETAITSTAAVVSGASLLGFQEIDPDEGKRRQAFKKGRLTLEALAQLRDALLLGSLPFSALERLEKLVTSERAQTTDPALNAILDEIELRAAVELAKIEVALANRGA